MKKEAIRQRQIAFVNACKAETGLDGTNLARLIGVHPSTINRFVTPQADNCLHPTTIAGLEEASGLSYATFDESPRKRDGAKPTPLSLEIPVLGEVRAGVWQMQFNDAVDASEFVVLAHPGDTSARYFALRVAGDSMDMAYAPGTILICVPTLDFWGEMQNGEHVIVQRRSETNEEFEYTVKELHQDADGGFWLVPRSTNPVHQAIRYGGWDCEQPQAGNGDIEVIGVVVGHQRWRHRPGR